MLYLSIALIITALIFTWRPPSYTVNHTHRVIEDNHTYMPVDPKQEEAGLDDKERNNLTQGQPDYDEVAAKVNEVLHELQFGEEDHNDRATG